MILSALMFLLATHLAPQAPPQLSIPGFIQIGLGIAGAIAGVFLWRGNTAAKVVLAFIGICVVANVVFALILAVTLIPRYAVNPAAETSDATSDSN